MNKVLQLLSMLLSISIILGGCLSADIGNNSSVPEKGNQSTGEAEESTEAEPEPIAFDIVFHEYWHAWETGGYFPKVVRSVEELVDYCGELVSQETYDSDFFAENSLILFDYSLGTAQERIVIEDVTENEDETVNLVVVDYMPEGGSSVCYHGTYVIAVNRVLNQEQVSRTVEQIILPYAEYMERFGDTEKPFA